MAHSLKFIVIKNLQAASVNGHSPLSRYKFCTGIDTHPTKKSARARFKMNKFVILDQMWGSQMNTNTTKTFPITVTIDRDQMIVFMIISAHGDASPRHRNKSTAVVLDVVDSMTAGAQME